MSIHRFDRGAKGRETGDMIDVARQEKLLVHIEHEQRLHAVKRKPFPGLSEHQERQPPRMPEDGLGRHSNWM
jgi:hypothetical protein